MLIVVLCLIILLSFLDSSARRGQFEVLKLEKSFELFAIRDELRRKLIQGKIPADNWFFYLDTSITKTIEDINKLTIWEAVALIMHYEKNNRLSSALDQRAKAMRKNPELAAVFVKYIDCVSSFLRERHGSLIQIVRLLRKAVDGLAGRFSFDKAVRVISSSPETSTLLQYQRDRSGFQNHRLRHG